jgi:hypothetical protein
VSIGLQKSGGEKEDLERKKKRIKRKGRREKDYKSMILKSRGCSHGKI